MGALGSWLGSWLTFEILAASAVLAVLYTLGILAMEVFGGNPSKIRRMRPKMSDRDGKDPAAASSRLSRYRKAWGIHFGVPATLATWGLVALEWAGCGLPWPPI